jgi:hypothetical protein
MKYIVLISFNVTLLVNHIILHCQNQWGQYSVSHYWYDTSWSFPHSWFITGFVNRVTWRVSLVEQELLTMSSPSDFSGVRVARPLVLSVVFCRSLFVIFLLAIVLSVLLRFTDSTCPFGIFQLFFLWILNRLMGSASKLTNDSLKTDRLSGWTKN